jgi:hypothetical protein
LMMTYKTADCPFKTEVMNNAVDGVHTYYYYKVTVYITDIPDVSTSVTMASDYNQAYPTFQPTSLNMIQPTITDVCNKHNNKHNQPVTTGSLDTVKLTGVTYLSDGSAVFKLKHTDSNSKLVRS